MLRSTIHKCISSRGAHRRACIGLTCKAVTHLLAWLALLGSCLPLPAQADLIVSPTRVVLDNRRTAQLDLINNGTEPATYRIKVVNRRMSDSGEFMPANEAEPGERFADGMLHYAPRQVRLGPGESQVVRLAVRKPADLPEGEYRSHLLFERVPEAQGPTSIENRVASDGALNIQLTALIGVSIPVIVRHGQTHVAVRLSELDVAQPDPKQPPVLSLSLNREGNRSVYGDLLVTFVPHDGQEQEIARAAGVAIYAPNPTRRIKLFLQSATDLADMHGTLTAAFSSRREDGAKLVAREVLRLP